MGGGPDVAGSLYELRRAASGRLGRKGPLSELRDHEPSMTIVVTITCPNGHEFETDEAAATFDGSEARYQCPGCGRWVRGPPPGC